MEMDTIDVTPTWEGIFPLLVIAATNGTTAEARKTAMEELRRMARLADSVQTLRDLLDARA